MLHASGYSLSNYGVSSGVTLEVASGGTAIHTTVDSGGYELASADGATISGGTVELGKETTPANGTIVFAGGGNSQTRSVHRIWQRRHFRLWRSRSYRPLEYRIRVEHDPFCGGRQQIQRYANGERRRPHGQTPAARHLHGKSIHIGIRRRWRNVDWRSAGDGAADHHGGRPADRSIGPSDGIIRSE